MKPTTIQDVLINSVSELRCDLGEFSAELRLLVERVRELEEKEKERDGRPQLQD